jgi:hypothetical protein
MQEGKNSFAGIRMAANGSGMAGNVPERLGMD